MIRCRSAKGQQVLSGISASTSTFKDLKAAVSVALGIEIDKLSLKWGFPPTSIIAADEATLESLGLRPGDTVIGEQQTPQQQQQQAQTNVQSLTPSNVSTDGVLVRRIMADDNSCLFSAIGYVLENKSRSRALALREVVANTIMGDDLNYSEAILGRSNKDYCNWIKKPESWGGGIELSIFAKHYQCEIFAFDVQTLRVDRFGQDAGYDKCVFLIYNGIHFDALALSSDISKEHGDQTIFPLSNQSLIQQLIDQANKITLSAHKNHEFTDLASFTLRCSICRVGLRGQKEAQAHALQTGHAAFEEYL